MGLGAIPSGLVDGNVCSLSLSWIVSKFGVGGGPGTCGQPGFLDFLEFGGLFSSGGTSSFGGGSVSVF